VDQTRTLTVQDANLLSKLGHELRTPVSGIIGLTHIMTMKLARGPVDTAEQLRQLEMVSSSAERLLTIIERVVDVSRADTRAAVATVDSCDAREVIADLVAEFDAVTLTVDMPRPVPLPIGAEPLRRMLHELLDNAARYAGATTIQIHAEGRVITVSDDGAGIPVDEQAALFRPFQRGEAAARSHPGGVGLGLYLARRLAGHAGATLQLASEAGRGTTVRTEFP
jgi:signal transduction histidine kinase